MAHTAVSQFLYKYLFVPLVVVWACHLWQRRYVDAGNKKRLASLLIPVLFIVLWIVSYLFLRIQIDDLFLIPVFLAVAGLAVWQRKRFFPYRFTCASCGASLPIRKILFFDSNACDACDPPQPKKEIPS